VRFLTVTWLAIWVTAAGACGRSGISETHFYRCRELDVTATFHGDGPVELTYSGTSRGTSLSLARVSSASGARYADDSGDEFWTQDGAMIAIAGQERRTCTRVD
jgi:putative lipoprotein